MRDLLGGLFYVGAKCMMFLQIAQILIIFVSSCKLSMTSPMHMAHDNIDDHIIRVNREKM